MNGHTSCAAGGLSASALDGRTRTGGRATSGTHKGLAIATHRRACRRISSCDASAAGPHDFRRGLGRRRRDAV